MELIFDTDINQFPSEINFNFESLKSNIEAKVEKFKNLVVTDESIKSAKADRAALNNFFIMLDDERKRIKTVCLKPYEDYENKHKQLVKPIKEAIEAIDIQAKELEHIKKEQKYAELLECFNNNVKELADFVTLDRIINPKWQNVSQSIESLKGEIYDKLDRIRDDIKFLTEMYDNKSYKEAVYQEYFKNLSREKTMAYALILEKNSEMQNKVIERVSKKETVAENVEIKEDVSIGKAIFEVIGTRSQLSKLKEFMKKTGIEFRVIR